MAFSASRQLFSAWTNRAIVYSHTGDPCKVLTSLRYPPLPTPAPNTVNIQFILAPINPADLNVIEGSYPLKPSQDASLAPYRRGSRDHPVIVAGNEGLAQVTDVGSGVHALEKHDWVVMARQQIGTWCTNKNVAVPDVMKIPRAQGLSKVHGATMTASTTRCNFITLLTSTPLGSR